ncbi:MAG: hypothetical protein WCA13_05505 [Terriglobales bacterium]
MRRERARIAPSGTVRFEEIKVEGKSNGKIKSKGSGQECPLYTYFGISSATVS